MLRKSRRSGALVLSAALATLALVASAAVTGMPAHADAVTDSFDAQDTARWAWGPGASIAHGQLVLEDSRRESSLTSVERRPLRTFDVEVKSVPRGAYLVVVAASNWHTLEWYLEGDSLVAVLDGRALERFSSRRTGARWLRVGVNGSQAVYSTSSDGQRWTDRVSRSIARPHDPFDVDLYAGRWNGRATSGVILDNATRVTGDEAPAPGQTTAPSPSAPSSLGPPTPSTPRPSSTPAPTATAPSATAPSATAPSATAPSATATSVPSPTAPTVPKPSTPPALAPDASASTAAERYGWGKPVTGSEFTDPNTLAGPDWDVFYGPGYQGKGRQTDEAVKVENGSLVITGQPDGTTGAVGFFGSTQKYGRWESRIRVPQGSEGYHPVALLWPTSERWPDDGEINYFETTGAATRNTFSLHHAHGKAHVTPITIDRGWHTYAVEWTPTSITGYLDGKPYYTTTNTREFPPGTMWHSYQLDWMGSRTAASTVMEVDWLRVYPVS